MEIGLLLSISSLQVGVYPDTEDTRIQKPGSNLHTFKKSCPRVALASCGSERSHGPPEPDGPSGDLRARPHFSQIGFEGQMRNSFWLSSIEKRSEVLTNLAVPFTQRRLPAEQWFNTSDASGNLCQMQLSTAAGPYTPSSLLSSVLRTENQKPERQASWHLVYLSGPRND